MRLATTGQLQLLIVAIVAVFVTVVPSEGFSQYMTDDPRFRLVVPGRPLEPSLDSTPVEFTIGEVRYRVPRNYIIRMHDYSGGNQSSVGFKVTFPGFEPLTEKTSQCLTKTLADWPPGCMPVQFNVGSGWSRILPDEDWFKYVIREFSDPTPKSGPGGFEVYETGEGNQKQILYKKKTRKHLLLFLCYRYKLKVPSNGLCNNHQSKLGDGNAIDYDLYIEHIKNAEAIDNGIRELLESFRIEGETP
jgi:hypothetical protein